MFYSFAPSIQYIKCVCWALKSRKFALICFYIYLYLSIWCWIAPTSDDDGSFVGTTYPSNQPRKQRRVALETFIFPIRAAIIRLKRLLLGVTALLLFILSWNFPAHYIWLLLLMYLVYPIYWLPAASWCHSNNNINVAISLTFGRFPCTNRYVCSSIIRDGILLVSTLKEKSHDIYLYFILHLHWIIT
jgi:hypothetical protein